MCRIGNNIVIYLKFIHICRFAILTKKRIEDRLFLGSLVLAQSRILFTVAGQFSIVGQCGKMYCTYAEELMNN